MAEKLTKDLLKEKKDEFVKTIEVVAFGDSFEIDIKPLTGPQTAEVEGDSQTGITLIGESGGENAESAIGNQSMNINLKENSTGTKTSEIKACAFGTVDEDFSKSFIEKNWPNNLIGQVAREVKKLSNINVVDNKNKREVVNDGKVERIEGAG